MIKYVAVVKLADALDSKSTHKNDAYILQTIDTAIFMAAPLEKIH
jgi:hypothetical protein